MELTRWMMQRDGTPDGPIGLDELVHRPQWQAWAACRDEPTETFFPGRGQDPRPAKRICAGCPVATECREYATAMDDPGRPLMGIWAGTSERSRRQERRLRAVAS
ncbi:MAG TPA: WhiB family transcriptional regulator [Acidimicrobiales bacterium]|nr:WhiB family transcriptional regulator [Acidimicrobiales bacterium]